LPIEAIVQLCIYTRMSEYTIMERIEAGRELLKRGSGFVQYLV